MMSRVGRKGRWGNRGILLISSYLVLSLFLIYSSAMTLRTNTQRLVSDRLRDRFQAMDMAQGAMEEFRNDLYEYFRVTVYHDRYGGDALSTMAWLDAMRPGSGVTPDPNPASSDPRWGMFQTSPIESNVANSATGIGTAASPRRITLPSMTGKNWVVKAWVVDVVSVGGILSPRDVTIEAQVVQPNPPGADVVLRRIRATYRFELAASDIFRYAYFINNYGWFTVGGGSRIQIQGEARSNGDLTFAGDLDFTDINGDLFASQNNELLDSFGAPVQGLIFGDPGQDDLESYFYDKRDNTRPERRKTFPGEPAIGGGPMELLPYGQGWDTPIDWAGALDNPEPQQQRFERQSTQDMPYLGDLALYRTLAQQQGSTLTFATPGADGIYGSLDDGQATVNAVHAGSAPLVIVGTDDHPIQINGPVVVEGDVIIKGVVSGRGTIYAGRNVHIVGDIVYGAPPSWPSLERQSTTGKIRAVDGSLDLGSVCSNGVYVSNTVPVVSRCT